MTRRALEFAVIEAARKYERKLGRTGLVFEVGHGIFNSVRALDACTEPDLVALNAAVAEAAETLCKRWDDLDCVPGDKYQHGPLTASLRSSILSRREALKPKPRPRYTIGRVMFPDILLMDNGRTVLQVPGPGSHDYALMERIAALLNANVKEKP